MDLQLSRPTYLDVDDTCAEVEITKRQLTHWEEQGLLHPQLGRGSRKYTPIDIRRLKYLRNLIVEKKLPISFLKDLLNAGQHASLDLIGELVESLAVFGDADADLDDKVFEFASRRIEDKFTVADDVAASTLPYASQYPLEVTVLRRVLLLFRIFRLEYPHPAALRDRLEEFMAEVEKLSRVARVDIWGSAETGVESARFHPEFEDDEEIDIEKLGSWFLPKARLLDEFRQAVMQDELAGKDVHPSVSERFWPEDDLAAVKRDWDQWFEQLFSQQESENSAEQEPPGSRIEESEDALEIGPKEEE